MVRVACVGAGYWGKNLIRQCASLPDSHLERICDTDPGVTARLSPSYPQVRMSLLYEEVLADPQVEAVVLATPSPQHAPMARQALLAGKHAFVEKPMAITREDAEELAALAEQRGLTLMVGHLMVYHPAVTRLKGMIDRGELGKVYYLYAQRTNLGRVRSDENALVSFGPHDISVICHLLDSTPVEVVAQGESFLQEGVEDVVFVHLKFPSRVRAHVQLSWLDPHKARTLTVVGSQRMVVFDDVAMEEKIRIYDKGVDRSFNYNTYADYLAIRDGDIHIPHLQMEEPLKLEVAHFLHCVQTGQTPRSSGREGVQVARVLDAAQKSLSRGGVPITVD